MKLKSKNNKIQSKVLYYCIIKKINTFYTIEKQKKTIYYICKGTFLLRICRDYLYKDFE